MPSVAACTVACVLMRLRNPHPVRFVGQPGAMACFVATVMIVLATAVAIGVWAITADDHRLGHLSMTYLLSSLLIGIAIFLCWVMMRLNGRWHPEPT